MVTLANGDVLAAGGIASTCISLASAELYHPNTSTWTVTAPMNAAGYNLTATLLPSGNVLVTGQGPGNDGEVFHPAPGKWTNTGPMAVLGNNASAVLLGSGKVLVTGGGTATAQIYDPPSNAWSATGGIGNPSRR